MNLSAYRGRTASFRVSLLAGSGLALMYVPHVAAQEVAQHTPQQTTEQVLVEGQRQDYKLTMPALSKFTEPLLDVPQSISVVTEQLLKDRGVTNLNDALRNVPGITIGAGEFRSAGNTPTIRGFVARTDMYMDGIRDFGSYYRDPFNDEAIEVLEGPASVLFGRGSTGGVINQVSKLPKMQDFVSGTLVGGSDLTRRVTVDLNHELPELGTGAAFRITAMGHEAKVAGRNVVENSRLGISPSLALGLGTPTRLTFSYYHMNATDVPDYGLPYFGTVPADIPRQNFYGFDSDFRKTGTDIGTFKAEHDYSNSISVRNQVRYAYYTRDFRFTEPLIATTIPLTTPLSSIQVTRNVDSGNGQEAMLWDTADSTFRFETGALSHSLVVGIEGGREQAKVEFDNSTGVPNASLLAPNSHIPFAGTTFPRTKTDTTVKGFGVFALDTIKWGDWELSGGIRFDDFDTNYHDVRYSTTSFGTVTGTNHITRNDSQPSYRAALTYKPQANGSIYLAYGTSFNSSADDLSFVVSSRNFNISNAFLDPEENQNFELGTKWNVLDGRLAFTAAVFDLEKKNARVPDPGNSTINILGGDQRVKGFETQIVGRITENWQITAGYAYLDSRVEKTTAGGPPVGSPLMNTPKHALTFWTTYDLGSGFEIGGGGRYVSSQYTQNVPPIKTVPSFWDFDAMAKYTLSERLSLQLNVNNVFDKYYYDQLHFFHVVPGPGRTALLSINFNY